jgi:DNA-binding CsgD family transcriptional regulator
LPPFTPRNSFAGHQAAASHRSLYNNFAIYLFNLCIKIFTAMTDMQNSVSNATHLKILLTTAPVADIPLSPRETEVMILMCKEQSTKQIAALMGISPYTVESHKKSLRIKTGSYTELGVVIFAVKNNIFMFGFIISLF